MNFNVTFSSVQNLPIVCSSSYDMLALPTHYSISDKKNIYIFSFLNFRMERFKDVNLHFRQQELVVKKKR